MIILNEKETSSVDQLSIMGRGGTLNAMKEFWNVMEYYSFGLITGLPRITHKDTTSGKQTDKVSFIGKQRNFGMPWISQVLPEESIVQTVKVEW